MYVQLNNLSFRYRNAKLLTIENINLSIEQGEFISILGKSGSGKSTILRLIAGLEVPVSGSILINGRTIADEKQFLQPEKRGVGMVFQDYALFPHMTVAANVGFGLRNKSKKEMTERIEKMLALVGMTDYGSRYPYELSGGQQQRVALARALAPNPSLMMLDEPFSNLDTELQVKIREDLQKIIKKAGVTSIIVTHNQEDAKALADRVVIMNEGRITKIGKPSDLLD